jgi:hypothetical protein
MATRSNGPGAGFSWLNRGISAAFRHPKPLFGGAALLMLAALIPTLITWPIQFLPLPPAAFAWIMVLSMLLGILVLPLYAGYLQMVDALEQGRIVRAGDIIRPYREGKALRLMGYGLLIMVAYAAMFGIVIAATGVGGIHWYMQALMAQASHAPPPTTLPDGFGITMLLMLVIGIFMMGFYSISLGQVSLRNRGVFGAIGDGVAGTLKNLLPLLMLALGLVLLWIAICVCIGIAVLLIVLISKLVGAWLVFAVVIPIYIALLVVGFASMFGVMYHLWRDVCGGSFMTGAAESFAA